MYSGGLQVVVAVTGDVAEPQQKAISRGWPAVNSADRLLESMALLVAAPNNQFVTLAAAETEDGPARVKAHRELLTKASPYFDALLNAGFAETSALGGASTPTPAVQTGKRTSTDHQSGSAADTSAAPVINLYDVSYEQLQALVYYVYTGIAVFKGRRPSKKDKKAAEESSKKGASSLVVSPWNNGTIEPIDALEMYRIADKYDFDELRLSALRWIAADISIDTLVEDLKSREALHIFPPVKRLYLEFCMRNQDQISKLSAYDEIMNYFVANHYLV
ncbi:hypothetical protein BCV70DRAFT_164643 [Testicularia cyperi]|uniref:BTB domain-containing protein n=1 Tax=Testicularia cyperi TaxID=1882483 RepID=A0A317XKC1_9BASI|nr:hypothetical protein BCV70DRAFT_164643 [Testicularia cyperi]